ncbi:LacI family transcriptional regulator [bacterium]|nr:LacI family transcriptional regulator [bacterium]
MTTIKDVAKKAGVSVGTVSNVLNELDTVTDKNKSKVINTIKSLGYKPNKIAASLSRKKTMNIGLIIPDVSSPFYSDLIKGVTETLDSHGYNVFLCSSSGNINKEAKIINDLLSMWIDGIILIPIYSSKRDKENLEKINNPIVLVNREIKGFKCDMVIFDNFGGAYEATNFLIKNYHKKIIILDGPRYSKSFEDRLMGWKASMEENNLYKSSLIFRGDFSVESGREMMLEAFSKLKEIDAVFASSDLIALGALNAIEEKNMKVPDDISIIGFGDIFLSKFLKPSLTTVRRPFYNIGKTAVLILLEKISGNCDVKKFKKFIVKGKLEIRNSVRKKI